MFVFCCLYVLLMASFAAHSLFFISVPLCLFVGEHAFRRRLVTQASRRAVLVEQQARQAKSRHDAAMRYFTGGTK